MTKYMSNITKCFIISNITSSFINITISFISIRNSFCNINSRNRYFYLMNKKYK